MHFPALSDTVTLHNSDLLFYYNNLIFIIDFGDDQNAFFSLANVFTFAAAVALALPAKANTWPLPSADSRLVGENKFHVVENDGGSLEAIAKKYNVGFLALLQANPGVDPYVPRAGSVLTIPLQTLLPDAPREGIVINIAELRLYYYPPGKIR